jgi:hypothetical protein
MMIMSMGWDYVSELRLPTGLLFIPQVIFGHREPRWMMSTGENSQSVYQSALWQSYQLSYLAANREDMEEWNDGHLSAKYFFHTRGVLLHTVKSYDMRPTPLLPLRRKVCCGFLSPLKILHLGRVWTREPLIICYKILSSLSLEADCRLACQKARRWNTRFRK